MSIQSRLRAILDGGEVRADLEVVYDEGCATLLIRAGGQESTTWELTHEDAPATRNRPGAPPSHYCRDLHASC